MARSDWRTPVAFAHRWLGALVGAVFVATGLSGTLLAYAPEVLRASYPALDTVLDERWQDTRADVLAGIDAAHDSVELVRFPTAALPAYEVYLADGAQAYHDPVTGALLLTRAAHGDALMFAHDLHIHLLAGEAGERTLGWLGIAMAVMLVVGIWLWWPRGPWRFALRRPAGAPLAVRWLWWHKQVGIVSLSVLLFVTVTGFGIIFYAQAQAVLTTLFGGDPQAPTAASMQPAPVEWPAVLATLDATLPAGRTVFYYPGDAATFRKQMPGELHPNGRSFIRIAGDGTLLSANDASRSAPGQRMTNAMYPLHAGRAGSETWRAVVALSGLLPAFFFVTGVITWTRRRAL